MEMIDIISTGVLWLLYIGGGVLGIVFFSYMGTLIYDELKGRTNDLYELYLVWAVRVEYLLRGRPKKEYQGRHHRVDPFVHELVKELREYPLSLCYRPTHRKALV
jgi:hypothetical protein